METSAQEKEHAAWETVVREFMAAIFVEDGGFVDPRGPLALPPSKHAEISTMLQQALLRQRGGSIEDALRMLTRAVQDIGHERGRQLGRFEAEDDLRRSSALHGGKGGIGRGRTFAAKRQIVVDRIVEASKTRSWSDIPRLRDEIREELRDVFGSIVFSEENQCDLVLAAPELGPIYGPMEKPARRRVRKKKETPFSVEFGKAPQDRTSEP